MGLFSNIVNKQIKSFTRGACKAMSGAFNLAKKRNPQKKYREQLALALSTRPRWKQVDKFKFELKNSHELEIEKEDQLKDVIRNVVLLETSQFGGGDLHERANKMQVIISEISEFFNKK